MRKLPPPRTSEGLPVEAALSARRSQRAYLPDPLTDDELGQVLWAAEGVTLPKRGFRTTPSAGATFPLEIHVADADGVWRYDPPSHALQKLSDDDVRSTLADASLSQRWMAAAPVQIVIAAVIERTSGRYGPRAERYVNQEVGCAAQGIALQAISLGLVTCMVGAYNDAAVAAIALLPPNAVPLDIMTVGRPARGAT